MPLKTLVKVGNITNLSDARYCAGMGVDFLGFSAIQGHPQYISPKNYQDIRGWVAGPKFVIELYGLTDAGLLDEIITQYAPDYLECSLTEYSFLASKTDLPIILFVKEGENLNTSDDHIAFVLTKNKNLVHLASLPHNKLVLIEPKEDVEKILTNRDVKGLALTGSQEIRPGYKDYDDLAEVLEKLEE